MRGSKEKKNGQEQSNDLLSTPKTARAKKQDKEERRSNIMYATIAVVFVVVAIICLVWKSNVIPKHATAVTIDDENYTAAEVNFYFNNVYQGFVNQNYNYLSMLGLDPSQDLRDQTMGDQSWYDYFLEQALSQMTQIQMVNKAAEENDFTWNDTMQSQLDSSMDSLKEAAANYGYTEKQYLGLLYGSTMTPKVYEEQMRTSILAEAYMNDYTESLSYTDDQLVESYQADPNSFDKVDYSSIRVNAAPASVDAEGNEIEVTDEMKDAAKADAKAAADKMLAAVRNGSSMTDAANGTEGASATESAPTTYSDSVVGNWLFDSARHAGDSAVLEDEANSCYYVVSFEKRYREEYNLVNVRHILIAPEETTLPQDDPGYQDDVAAKKADAKAQAEKILKDWTSGEATEDSFIELVKEHSADSGSVPDGGMIPDISKDSSLVPPFLDWCFEEGRDVGDSGIVESDYGYHIMYLSSFGQPQWKALVNSKLTADDFNTWFADIVGDTQAEQHSFGMKFVN